MDTLATSYPYIYTSEHVSSSLSSSSSSDPALQSLYSSFSSILPTIAMAAAMARRSKALRPFGLTLPAVGSMSGNELERATLLLNGLMYRTHGKGLHVVARHFCLAPPPGCCLAKHACLFRGFCLWLALGQGLDRGWTMIAFRLQTLSIFDWHLLLPFPLLSVSALEERHEFCTSSLLFYSSILFAAPRCDTMHIRIPPFPLNQVCLCRCMYNRWMHIKASHPIMYFF